MVSALLPLSLEHQTCMVLSMSLCAEASGSDEGGEASQSEEGEVARLPSQAGTGDTAYRKSWDQKAGTIHYCKQACGVCEHSVYPCRSCCSGTTSCSSRGPSKARPERQAQA